MKAAVLESIGQLRVREIDDPRCEAGDVVVSVEACAICGTDLKMIEHGHRRVSYPQTIGHEIAGRVVTVGSSAVGVSVGDPVTVAPAGVGCGSCAYCRDGLDNVCADRRGMGYEWAGGFAELVRIPEAMILGGNLHPIPDGLSFAEAALAEPLACVLNCHEQLRLAPNEAVVIVGAGPIGIMHAMAARSAGAGTLVVLDVAADRLQNLPASLGAVAINASERDVVARVRDLTDGLGAHAVVVAAPDPSAQAQSVDLARKGGRVAFFAGLPAKHAVVPLNTNKIHYDELLVFGTANARSSHAREALALLRRWSVDAQALITHRFPLAGIEEAVRAARGGTGLKVIVEPQARP